MSWLYVFFSLPSLQDRKQGKGHLSSKCLLSSKILPKKFKDVYFGFLLLFSVNTYSFFRDNVSNKKSPKLFFISSSSTTSTLSTTTLCYTSINNAAAGNACSGKKKRAIMNEALGVADNIEAQRTSVDIEDDDIISSIDEATSSQR